MAFIENIKLIVKRNAAFRCCRCHEIGIEVHHIIPQADKGSDDIDNAAPLCPNCHTNFGGNSERRKDIRQMRDWWYEVVKEKYYEGKDKWEKINELVLEIQNGHKQMEEIEDQLRQLHSDIRHIKANTPDMTRFQTNEYITAQRLANNVHANFTCKKCGTVIGLLIGSNECPNCHTTI